MIKGALHTGVCLIAMAVFALEGVLLGYACMHMALVSVVLHSFLLIQSSFAVLALDNLDGQVGAMKHPGCAAS